MTREVSDEAAVLRPEDKHLIKEVFSSNAAKVQVYESAFRTLDVPHAISIVVGVDLQGPGGNFNKERGTTLCIIQRYMSFLQIKVTIFYEFSIIGKEAAHHWAAVCWTRPCEPGQPETSGFRFHFPMKIKAGGVLKKRDDGVGGRDAGEEV